jgi:hypothetical protein
MRLVQRVKPKYATKADQIVAELRDAAGAAAPVDPKMLVKRKAAEISTAMALVHGGDWRVVIDHENQMVLIRRD